MLRLQKNLSLDPRAWLWVVVALLIVVGDVALRHEIMRAWSGAESRQYTMSAVLSFVFWGSFFGLSQFFLRFRFRLLLLTAWCLFGAFLLWLPLSVYRHYGNYPTRDGFLFFSNQISFAVESLGFVTHPFDVVMFAGLWVLLFSVSWLHRPVRGFSQWSVSLPLVCFNFGIYGWANVRPSIPVTPEANTLRFIAKVAEWKSNPPEFFNLSTRYAKPFSPPEGLRRGVNVLWVVGETTAAQYLPYNPMPKLERFMRRGDVLALSNLHSNASCTDLSVPSILSGKSPVTPVAELKETRLLADFFRPAGFRTFLYSSHSLKWANLGDFLKNENLEIMEGAETVDPEASHNSGIDDDLTLSKSLTAIRNTVANNQNFLVVAHLNTTHPPYALDENHMPFSEQSIDQPLGPGFIRYLNSMSNLDNKLARFFETLEADGRFDDTLIVYTSDHGEAFGQHGIFSHCGKFYAEETHVPGLIYLPPALRKEKGKIENLAKAKNQFRMNVDLLPTTLDLMGVDPTQFEFSGYSMAQPWKGNFLYHFSNCSEYRRCPIRHFGVFVEGFKFLYHADKNRWEAFNVALDPRDQDDVIEENKPLLDSLIPTLKQNSTFQRLLERG